jgi:death-on-curing protein
VRFDRVVQLAESALAAPAAGFGGVDAYPDFAPKAAVLCARIIKNHPLPDGNKRVAYLCLLDFIERNGYGWRRPSDDEIVFVIEGIADGSISERELARWLEELLIPPEGT